MAKQQVYEFDNGATLIYQKQTAFNGYSFVIGFNGGSKLDGKYKGLSHLVEHLFFRSSSDDKTANTLNTILKYSINQNAFTSSNNIAVVFQATQKNVELALENCMSMITNQEFSENQIKQEIEIIKQEVQLYKNSEALASYESQDLAETALIESLSCENTKIGRFDSLGTAKTLNLITPEILTDYVKKYFNTNNLVISVTSNRSVEEVIKLCSEKIIDKLPKAETEDQIIPLPDVVEYKPITALCAVPNPNCQNVTINLFLKERNDYSENIEKEYAYDTIEENMLNDMGGILYDVLRIKNKLVYHFCLSNVDEGTAKFKKFSVITTSSKMRKTIRELCATIKGLAENGFPRELFEATKQALVDIENSKLQKFKTCSAIENFDDYIDGIPFVDYKKADKYLREMTYEDFNNYIKSVYKKAEVSLSAYGNFDKKKMFYLIEIEKMLGNMTHQQVKHEFNTPVMEVLSQESEEAYYDVQIEK